MAREISKNARKIKSNYSVRADRTKAQRDQFQALWASVDQVKENGVNKTVKSINGIPKIVKYDCDDVNMSVHSVSTIF